MANRHISYIYGIYNVLYIYIFIGNAPICAPV